ncbi:MAG: PadR family transcriptional regulator [SAR202 cluster bacterium]|nr:PadR family transcriptional regulator [SAR202 cluster bacterium]
MYKRELLKGNTETLVLSLLAEAPMHGYRLVKEIEARSDGYFRVKDGTVYQALHRLEREGLVQSRWDMMPNWMSRRCYEITAAGAGVLATQKVEWRRFWQALGQVMEPGRAGEGGEAECSREVCKHERVQVAR